MRRLPFDNKLSMLTPPYNSLIISNYSGCTPLGVTVSSCAAFPQSSCREGGVPVFPTL